MDLTLDLGLDPDLELGAAYLDLNLGLDLVLGLDLDLKSEHLNLDLVLDLGLVLDLDPICGSRSRSGSESGSRILDLGSGS